MPHRDPQTGQFVSDEGEEFDDIEVVTFNAKLGVEASNLSGATAFSGGDKNNFSDVELVDYDSVVDRNESLKLLAGNHGLKVYVNSSSTSDGTCRFYGEISSAATNTLDRSIQTTTIQGPVVGQVDDDDSIDLVGRPLVGVSYAPHSDGASGTGGGGSEGLDDVRIEDAPMEFGQFHPRDELFLNGRFDVWNIDDAGVHAEVTGQHIYGVMDH